MDIICVSASDTNITMMPTRKFAMESNLTSASRSGRDPDTEGAQAL